VVVSHDRYFLERVTDTIWALLGDGTIGLLPGGVDQYLHSRREAASAHAAGAERRVGHAAGPSTGGGGAAKPGSADERSARKAIARIDKQLERLAEREAALHAEMAESVSDHERLAALSEQLGALTAEKDALEGEWLEAAAILE
jgi:ATP-binding cassette subfamily F protein uup